MKLDENVVRMHLFHLFLIWPLIAGLCPFLMIYCIFCYFAPNFVTFDPWVWHKKRSDNIFQFFPQRVLVLSYAPLKFSKEKFVMATPPKLFDGIP